MIRKKLLLIAGILGLGLTAQAAILAGYDFDSGELDGEAASSLEANHQGANLTASGFGTGVGLTTAFDYVLAPDDALDAEGGAFGTANRFAFGGAGADFGFEDVNDSNDLSGAIQDNDYMEFTVTPNAGYKLNLESLSFRTYVETLDHSAERWALFSSVGGFTGGSEIVTGQTIDAGGWTNASNNVVVDLPGADFQGLEEAVTFRIYVYGGGADTNSITLFDKVVLNGTTAWKSILVGYDFDAGATDPAAATTVGDNLTAGPLTSPMGITFEAAIGDNSGAADGGETFGSTNTPGAVGIGVMDAAASSFATAVASDDYVSFTVTPDDGTGFHLSRLTFKATRGSANAVDEYAVTDGDGTLIGSTAVITNALGLTGAYEGVSVDLTGTACEFISGATEFRIYAWGRGTNATENTRAAIDKVVLFGNESNDSGRNSYFWMTLKPQAGTETGADTDLELANGYRKVDLSSPDLSCTRVDSGSNWVYQITWAGNNLVGGDDAETLQFNVVVDAFSGADYTYVADDAVVTSLGDASALTDVDNYWGVDGDSDLDAGESIRMTQQDVTVNGADLASNGLVLVERAFTNMKVLETNGGNSHKIIFGVGTNLATASFSAPTESYDVSGESFSVTGAGSNVGSRQWAISEVSFRLVVRNPALTEEDPDYPFSDIAEGHAYGPTPYEPTTSNKLAQAFPRFSWDIIPRTMLVRKGSNSFTDDEAERMANRYDFVVLEKANGSIEGYHDKASALKAFNPDIKVVFYWNSRIYYGHYGVDDSINDHWDEYIDPDFMIRGWPTYQRSNPDFIDWWVGVGHKMMGLVAGYATDGTTSFIPSPIDGYFIDKTGVPASMLQPLYEGSPDHKFCMNNNGDNRTRLPYLDGTYREGWTGGGNPTAIATAIALAQESGRNGKLTMLRNPYSGSSPRDMEDGVDFSLGIYLTYADEYAYFYHQASVDATDAGWQWLTDYYDQFQRPLGQPLGEAVRDGWIYTRSFERCDVFLELETDSGGKQSRILWKNDIGSPALAGSGASRTDDTYTLQGCGTLSGSSDQFFFLSDLHYGNGSISACIDHLDAAHADARAGVMFRERTEPTALDYTDTEYVDACVAAYSNGTVLAAGARTVAVLRDSAGQMNMVYRSATNGVLQTAGTLGPAFGPYAKLVRSGDTFTGYSSADGLSWTTIAQVTLPLAEKIEMGMAVASGENTALAEAMFSGFERIESAPTAAAQSVTTDEDTAVAITLSGSDGVGSTNFIYTVISPPAHGTLSGTAPNLTYTPEPNFFGADAFSFSVNDGFAESEEAAVSITVEPMDDAPVAHDLLVGTTKDHPVNITLAGTDPDGSNLTYRVVSLPTNGTLSGTAPDLLYTPAQLGSDHFTFDVDDGSATSGVATVTIDVTPFIYRDFFDGDGLDVNTAGVGGGAANTTLNSPASWSDDGDATYSAGGNYQDAALLYSTNAFQSTGGFELTVYYTCNNVATSGRNLFGFGLLEDAGSFSQNSSPFAEVASVYSIGVNLITESGVPRGLNFTDGSTVTALDGATFTAGAATPVVIRIEADGIGGADWSYSIDGTMEAAGHLDRFDFSRSFHFAAYGQDNERTKIIHSVELERLPEPGRYAVWAAGFGLEDEGALAGADADGDGYENLTEYALGMNPTNSDAGSRDWNNIWTEGGTNWFEYIHYRRTNYANEGLSYRLIDSTNLVDSVVSTNAQDQILVGPAVNGYEPVTNRYLTDDPAKFMQLKIRQE